jgi:hypothetical protein
VECDCNTSVFLITHFMVHKVSLQHSQVPANCPCPEPAQSSPYPPIPLPEDYIYIILLLCYVILCYSMLCYSMLYYIILYYIILPSVPGSAKWSLSFRFPHQNPVYTSLLAHSHYMPCPSHSSQFYHPNSVPS